MNQTQLPCKLERDPFDGAFMDSLIFDDDSRRYVTRRYYYGYDRIEILQQLHDKCQRENLEHKNEIALELQKLKKKKEQDDAFWRDMTRNSEEIRTLGVQGHLQKCDERFQAQLNKK